MKVFVGLAQRSISQWFETLPRTIVFVSVMRYLFQWPEALWTPANVPSECCRRFLWDIPSPPPFSASSFHLDRQLAVPCPCRQQLYRWDRSRQVFDRPPHVQVVHPGHAELRWQRQRWASSLPCLDDTPPLSNTAQTNTVDPVTRSHHCVCTP